MSRKPPSSLDYEALLHELELKGFRRAIRERDLGRALSYAGKLGESTDRFWRWQGFLDLASVHLLQGRASLALEFLDQAKAVYRDVAGLQRPADEQKACILLATGRLLEVYELARGSGKPSPFLLHLGRLARGQLKNAGDKHLGEIDGTATSSSEKLSGHFEAILRTKDALPLLRTAVLALGEQDRLTSGPGVYLVDALAAALLASGESERALALYREIGGNEEAAIAAPISFVRAFAQQARILAAREDAEAARRAWTTFLFFWNDGELDGELVAEGRRFTSE